MASDGEKAEERVPEGRGKVRVAWGDVIPSRWNEGCSSRLRSEASFDLLSSRAVSADQSFFSFIFLSRLISGSLFEGLSQPEGDVCSSPRGNGSLRGEREPQEKFERAQRVPPSSPPPRR